jgi:hypothetical protein
VKKNQIMLVYAAMLTLSAVTTLWSADYGRVQGQALVLAVRGNVEVQINGAWSPLQVNQVVPSGVKVRSGPDATADLSVNGASIIRITPNTTLAILEVFRAGPGSETDSATALELQLGSVVGQVRKSSAGSRCEIRAPHGLAGFGADVAADFRMAVAPKAEGDRSLASFYSHTGELTVSAVINRGEPPTVKVVRAGEQWTPGKGDLAPTPPTVVQTDLALIGDLVKENAAVQ